MSTKVFGVPLEQLTETDRKKHPDLRVPYIISHSLTSIIREGVDSEGIFRISGNKERVANLKDAFDRGEEVDFIKEKTNPNDVCSLFKMYMRELPEPILTYERYDKWLELHDMRDANKQRKSIKDLIDSLPATNRAVLTFIIGVLDKIAQSSSLNKMDSGNLSKTVGPNLLWKEGKGDSVEYLVHSGKVNHIVQLMIDDFEHYFPFSQDENSKYTALYSKLFGHKKSVHNMIRGSHENEIWSCDSAGQIRIWDVSTFTPVKEIETEQGRIFTLNRVKNTIWTTSQKCAKVWNTETKECIKKLDFFTYCAIEVQDKAWIGSEGKIVVVNSDFETVKEIPVPGVVFCMAVDTSGKYVWAGGNDKTIRIYDIQTFDLVKQLKEGHQRRVNCIVAVDDTIWTAGDDTSIFIWNAQSHTLLNQFEAHAGAIYALTLCGKNVWSCSWDTSIKVWNAKTMEKVHTLPNYHSDAVSSINIFYNKNRENWQAWTSSWDKSVCVWIIGQKLIPEGQSGVGEKKKKPAVSKEETKPKNAEEKMEELNKKTGELREKNTELLTKAKELKEKKHELAERREKLNKRKQELEEKKKDLLQRKEELSTLQTELESNNN